MQHIDRPVSRNGVILLRMAVIYLLLGLLLGLGMAMSGRYQLSSVHTHINLLGWVTLALAGLLYCLFPQLGTTPLARWHFWLHNLGLPVMIVALALYHLGHREVEPLLGIASLTLFAGLALFALNLFRTPLNSPVVAPKQSDLPVAIPDTVTDSAG